MRKILLAINSVTILISLYKIVVFIATVGKDVFAWWIPMGKIFSYTHFWQFVTLFVIPVPFGVYSIALIFYLLAALLLILKMLKGTYNLKYIIFSGILLVGVLGSFVILIGE